MFDKVLKFILLTSTLAYTTGMRIESFDHIYFHFGVIVLFIASLFDKPKREIDIKSTYLIASYVALGLLSCFWMTFEKVIISSFLDMFFCSLALYLIIRYADRPEKYYPYMVWGVLINLILFVMQRFGIHIIFDQGFTIGEEGGFMGTAPRLVAYLVIMLPLLIKTNIVLALACAVVSYICKEYMLLPIFLMLLFINGKLKARVLFSIIGFVGLAFALKFKLEEIESSFLTRFTIWRQTLVAYFDRPMQGWGIGGFRHASMSFIKYVSASGQLGLCETAFNSYIQWVWGAGVLGIAWLVYVFKLLKERIGTDIESLAIVSLLIYALVEYPFEIVRLWFTIIAWIGFLIIKKGECDGSYGQSKICR